MTSSGGREALPGTPRDRKVTNREVHLGVVESTSSFSIREGGGARKGNLEWYVTVLPGLAVTARFVGRFTREGNPRSP